MAYYTALINHWPSVLGANTAAKLANLNAETVTGQIPSTIYVTGDQVFNAIDFAEFNALTDAKQKNVLMMCSTPGPLLGGSAQTAHMLPGMLINYFSLSGPTITALAALSAATVQPWWQANGYPRAFDMGDIQVAGLS